MNPTGPFPAIPASQLGTDVTVQIDAELIPYLQGAIDSLTAEWIWNGTDADVRATIAAFEDLMVRLSQAL